MYSSSQYLCHALEYVKIWRFGIGYISEQSIEGYHQTCTQRGIQRIEYAIQRLMCKRSIINCWYFTTNISKYICKYYTIFIMVMKTSTFISYRNSSKANGCSFAKRTNGCSFTKRTNKANLFS